MRLHYVWLGLLFALALTASTCGSTGPAGSPTAPTAAPPASVETPPVTGNTSVLTVSMKDSPFSDAKALLITFSDVSAHLSGADWIKLPFSEGAAFRTCDLKKLVTAQDVLGVGPLPVGHYTQIRLVVASATIYLANATPPGSPACAAVMAAPAGISATVDIPSGEVKLNREFTLTSTTATHILVDFDGDKSVKLTGNGSYMMTPVIAIVSVTSPLSFR